MRTPEETKLLLQELIGSAEVMGQAMSPNAAAMIVGDLEGVPVNQVRAALRSVRKNHKSRLTYAVIREHLHKADGRPEANEAWALALQSQDERESLVWTTEVATAMEAARAILDAGDKVGARMAFISSYERLVSAARDQDIPVKWSLSMGWDVQGRALALEQAVRLERIPMDHAKALGYGSHLMLDAPAPDETIVAIAGMITGKQAEPRKLTPEVASRLAKLRSDIKQAKAKSDAEKEAQRIKQREELAEKKRAIDEAVKELALEKS